ncbi:aminoglycoside phosphotransferase family protein [Kitasatospora sp. NBC_01287]|uniref:aminoglycoside phosphotransferase family protein n=1 Tax=Kitasatospora sp. NBC_01287 TaxID=2903573 RepID=UPI002255A2E0|nr:aminoglycoside phosphotransferase family protein [Kitasatospora sp. NBC_01287]MCX4746415.1 aminoglycoside phosphotransferase family protein [Kitasatospora sp. NBC_01287]
MEPAAGQFTVPDRLRASVLARQGEPGARWLAALPERVARRLAHWDLTLDRIAEPGGRLSVICYVRRADNTPAVLKAGLVTPETAQEHAALTQWAGRGAVLLLDADPAEGFLLLERLHGEIPLRSLAEAKAMLEACGLLRRLWTRPADGHCFTSVADHVAVRTAWLREHPAAAARLDARPLVDAALHTAEELLASTEEEFLLHGDFHHGNVMAADRAPWLAIDPQPLVGERAFDLAWLAQDRKETLAAAPGPEGAVRRRLHQLSESLEVDLERLRGWTLFRSVAAGMASLAGGDRTGAELSLEFAGRL